MIEAIARAMFDHDWQESGDDMLFATDREYWMGFAQAAKDAYEAAIEQEGFVVVKGWQEIETAPKDGTNLLLARHDGDFPLIGFAYSDGVFQCVKDGEMWPQPTHWQPLPDPPIQAHRESVRP